MSRKTSTSGGRMADDRELRERTRQTARMLFHSLKGGVGFDTWKKFDKELARELSMFFTGKLYSREVISQKQRELCAVASLTVLHRPHELHAHIHAALNVGATRQEVGEVIFQQVTYGGMPVVVDALDVFKRVLEERGEWPD
jgi:4-carboxymuconolactone decarboxylase